MGETRIRKIRLFRYIIWVLVVVLPRRGFVLHADGNFVRKGRGIWHFMTLFSISLDIHLQYV